MPKGYPKAKAYLYQAQAYAQPPKVTVKPNRKLLIQMAEQLPAEQEKNRQLQLEVDRCHEKIRELENSRDRLERIIGRLIED